MSNALRFVGEAPCALPVPVGAWFDPAVRLCSRPRARRGAHHKYSIRPFLPTARCAPPTAHREEEVSETPGTGIGRVIVRNTLFSAGGRFIGAGIAFLVTPYIVYKLGTEGYGVWALMSVVTGYAGLLDLGVRSAFTKYVAEYNAKGDHEAVQGVVGTGILFYSGLGVLIFVLAFVFRDTLLGLLNVPAGLMSEARFALLCCVAAFCISNTFSAYGGVIDGLQRMDVSRSVSVGTSSLTSGAMVVVLALGKGLRGVASVALASSLLTGLALLVCALRVSPTRIGLGALTINRAIFRRLATFGLKLQGSALSSVGNIQLDKFLLAYFWNVRLVTFYELGLRAAMMLRSVPMLLVTAIVPAASDLHARGDKERLTLLYERGVKYVAAATYPFVLFPLVAAPYLVGAWLGPSGYRAAVFPLQFLALGYCFNVLTGVPNMIARGLGLLNYELAMGLAYPCVHLAIGLVLVPRFGLAGAVTGTTGAAIVVSLVGLVWVHSGIHISDKSFGRLWRETHAKPFAAAAVAGVIVYLLALVGRHWVAIPAARTQHIFWLGALSLAFAALYTAVLSNARFFHRDDVSSLPFLGRIPVCVARTRSMS